MTAALQTATYGRLLTLLAATESTNDDARAALSHGAPNGLTIVADHQTRGRGSRGRVWHSPAGTDLYLSIVDRPTLAPHVMPVLTLAVGLACADALTRFVGDASRVRIKWPNDVWVDDRKCCGILVEAVATGANIDGVVIGIGINVNRMQWPDDIAGQATSLALVARRELDRSLVLATLLNAVESRVHELKLAGAANIARQVDARLAWRGESIVCDELRGTLVGVAESGAVLIETQGTTRAIVAGTLRRA